jgi:hypothetical protein
VPTVITEDIKRAEVTSPDPAVAVQTLAENLHQEEMAGVIFFCSSSYDPENLALEFRKRFDCPVVGCTSAGEIGTHYQENGIVAVSFSAENFSLHPFLIESMADFDTTDVRQMVDSIRQDLRFSEELDPKEMFGLLLMDGLSVREEAVTAAIHSAIGGVSLIGGSAGDSLEFKETRVFAHGKFHTGAGIFMLIETRLPFKTFKLQHFEPSEVDMVITEADPGTRTVTEINGGPAAEEYAEILGLKADSLTPQIFASYPVMLQIGDQWFVRSIQKVNPDGSLTFFCAIDEGLPLTIAKGVGFVETLEEKVTQLTHEFSGIECTLGCDCILRRLELMESGNVKKVETALARLNFIGFSTFGEQFDSIHVNQTLTGVVLGKL